MAAAQAAGYASGYDSPPPGGGMSVGEGGFSSPQKAALANFPNTLALNEAWAVDGVLKQPEKVVRNPRRASAELRQDMRSLGEGRTAFFLAVEQRPLGSSFGLDPLKGAGASKIHPDSWERLPLDSQAAREDFNILRKIFNKGVQVSKDGCIYPHPRYCSSGEGDKRKAHQRVFLALMGVRTVGEQNKADEQTGWPNWAEISHYFCHHHKCCNPLHLQLQAAWLNRRRNYCGDSGQCDCGSTPPCQLRYSSSSPMQPDDLCTSAEEVERVLADTFASCGLRLKTSAEVADLDRAADKRAAKQAKRKATAADKRAQQEANAAKRAKTGEKQAFQAAKNAAKRVAKKLSSSSSVVSQEVQDAAEAAYLKHVLP